MEKNENDMNSGKRRGGGGDRSRVHDFLKNECPLVEKSYFSMTAMNNYRFPDWVINFIKNNWIRISENFGGIYVKPGLPDDRMQQLRDQFAGGRRRKRKSRRKKRRKSRKKTKTKRRRKRKTRKRR